MHIVGGQEKPIAYASRTLSQAEVKYAQIEQEALAIVFAVKKFHQYVYGREFVLVTDHKPLCTIFEHDKGIPTLAAARMQRWAIILGAYQYKIEFIPGSENVCADCMSRLPAQALQIFLRALEQTRICQMYSNLFVMVNGLRL